MIFYDSRRNRVELDSELDRGGEAAIYRVRGRKELVAKIYHAPLRPTYGQKLYYMQQNPPKDPTRPLGYASIAWPLELLFNNARQISGYLMPYMTGSVKLINVINPTLREKTLPGFNWKYLHRAARNLASSVRALHERNYIIGDLNESNILISPAAMITLIDTDSFQVTTIENGQIFFCPVGKPEYTPSELQGVDFRTLVRKPEADFFGLAVLVFQLLMEGSHPFRGKYIGRGEPPQVAEKIKNGWFPYGKKQLPLLPPPNSPGLEILHPGLAHLFVRCFSDGHRNPPVRPAPQVWIEALEVAESALVLCPKGHYYSRHLTGCPWCQREVRLSSAKKNHPHISGPHLEIKNAPTYFGLVSVGETATRYMVIANKGIGELRGTIRSDSIWLNISPPYFRLKSGESIKVTLTANTNKINRTGPVTAAQATLSIQSNGGDHHLQAQVRTGVPQLLVDRNSVDFGALARGDKASTSLRISNSGSGILSGNVTIKTRWVSASPTSFTCLPGANTVITLHVDTGQFTNSAQEDLDYLASILLNSNGGIQTIKASMRLVSPRLYIADPVLDLGLIPRGEKGSCQFSIGNHGGGELCGTIKPSAPWLIPDKLAFTVAPGAVTSVSLVADTSVLEGLPQGKAHSASLTIASNGGIREIPLRVLIGAPELCIPHTEIDSGTMQRGETRLTEVVVRNSGLGYLNGSLESSFPCFIFEPKNFTCKPHAEMTVPFIFDAGAAGIPLGHEAKANLRVVSDGGEQQITIKFLIESPVLKVVIHDDELKSADCGHIADFHFLVNNPGKADLNLSFHTDQSWLSVEPQLACIPPGQSGTLSIHVDRERLGSVGRSNTGEIQITANGASRKIVLHAPRQLNRLKVMRQVFTLPLAPDNDMIFVCIPAGDFIMGSPTGLAWDTPRDELLQTRLYLGEYWIGKYAVTNRQYKAFTDSTGHRTPEYWIGNQIPEGKEEHPVTHISWHDTIAFCRWLKSVTGYPIRLPGEGEWEKAARGYDERLFPWGNEAPDPGRCNYESVDTCPVDLLSPSGDSPYGCANMSGNVWEWTNSLSRPYPYQPDDGRESLFGQGSRVLRGGSWFSSASQVRATLRMRGNPDQTRDYFGFRCAFTI